MSKLFKTVGDYAYFHTTLGSDLFGDGSIDKPFESFAKGESVYPNKWKLQRGVSIEGVLPNTARVVGDEKWQDFIILTSGIWVQIRNIRLSLVAKTGIMVQRAEDSIVEPRGIPYDEAWRTIFYYDGEPSIPRTKSYSCTCFSSRYALQAGVAGSDILAVIADSIVYSNIAIRDDAFPGGTTTHAMAYAYCVFPSTAKFYRGASVVDTSSIQFTDDPIENVRILKRFIFPNWSKYGKNEIIDDVFGTLNINNQKIETCRIVKQQKDGGVLPNIFNNYGPDRVTPTDFYLNADVKNIALTAASNGGYVGALPPANLESVDNNVYNVNTTTGATSTAGYIVSIDTDTGNILSNDKSTYGGQSWNRLTTPVIQLDERTQFEGINNFLFGSGSSSGIYVGKRQNLFGPNLQSSGNLFTLEPNKKYKVRDSSPDDTLISDTGIIIRISGQADIPITKDNIFTTPSNISSIQYIAKNANVSVVEVLCDIFESIEVVPYDNMTTPSSFPKFSSPINDSCVLLYHRIGNRQGQPVLFSEVPNNKHSYFQSFAVSNADVEFEDLVEDSVNYYAGKVSLMYLSAEVNINYDPKLEQ